MIETRKNQDYQLNTNNLLLKRRLLPFAHSIYSELNLFHLYEVLQIGLVLTKDYERKNGIDTRIVFEK